MHSHPSTPQQVCWKHGGGTGEGSGEELLFPAETFAFPTSGETYDDALAFASAAASMSWHMQSPCAFLTPHPHPLEAASSRTRATHRPCMHLYWLQSAAGQPYSACENPGSSLPLQSGSCDPALQSHPSHEA